MLPRVAKGAVAQRRGIEEETQCGGGGDGETVGVEEACGEEVEGAACEAESEECAGGGVGGGECDMVVWWEEMLDCEEDEFDGE